jgi:hypothetical protein
MRPVSFGLVRGGTRVLAPRFLYPYPGPGARLRAFKWKGPLAGPLHEEDGERRLDYWPPTTPPASSIIFSEMIPMRSTPAPLAMSIAWTTRP